MLEGGKTVVHTLFPVDVSFMNEIKKVEEKRD
jgi:hypothetical protein